MGDRDIIFNFEHDTDSSDSKSLWKLYIVKLSYT